MADDINQVFLSGSLGADPELRIGASGTAVVKLRVATTKSVKKRGSETYDKVTEWTSVVQFGKRATFTAKDLMKGDRVTVQGELSTRSYDDRDGNKRYTTEVVASSVCYARRGDGQQASGNREQPRPSSYDDDEPPF